MTPTLDLEALDAHAGVVIALVCAESVLSRFVDHPDHLRVVRATIEDGWSWLETHTPDPTTLDVRFQELLDLDLQWKDRPDLLPALHCVMNMHVFLVWTAEGAAWKENPAVPFPVGNHIADVTDENLYMCLEGARAVTDDRGALEARLEAVIAWLERTHPRLETDPIGPPVARSQVPAG